MKRSFGVGGADGPFDKSRDFNPLDTAAAVTAVKVETAAKVNMEIQTRCCRFLSTETLTGLERRYCTEVI